MKGLVLEEIIQNCLKENDLVGENGADYDFGCGDDNIYYIDMWNFDIEKPIFTQEYLETQSLILYKEHKIKLLEENTSSVICSIYPLYKQININGRRNGYTDEDFANMDTYITDKIYVCRGIKAEINACETLQELELITIEE